MPRQVGFRFPIPTYPGGELFTTGSNNAGELGLGDTTSRSSPVQVGSLTNWKQISSSDNHTAAIKYDNTLWTWGLNSTNGELGLDDKTNRSTPVQVGTLTNWKQVACASSMTAAVKTDGTLWTWGAGSGQLGLGNTTSRSSPYQVGTLTNWSQVSLGSGHALAVKTDGTLWAWGTRVYGQLGLNINSGIDTSSPVQVGTLTNWYQVSCSGDSTAAVKTDGTLWGWGNNDTGQLGLSDGTSRSSPVQVGVLTNWSAVSIGGGPGPGVDTSTVAVKTDGTLWVWGSQNRGQLGLNSTGGIGGTKISSPVQLGLLTNWKQATMGSLFCVATRTDGTLWGWGENTSGQLGLNDRTPRSSPVQIGSQTYWSGVMSDSGTTASSDFIKLALNVEDLSTVVDMGDMFVEKDAFLNNGLYAWGQAASGELGQSSVTYRSSPVQVGSLTNWRLVSSSKYYTASLKTDGTLWVWGQNTAGQLGLNNTTNISSPVQIGTLTDWKTLSTSVGTFRPGTIATMSIKTDGTLWAWGVQGTAFGTGYGVLGLNDLVHRSSPTQVGSLTNWKQTANGYDHTLAVKTDGTLWAWGSNFYGHLGDNTLTHRSSPYQVGSLTNWKQVSAGQYSSAALKTDGTLWTWGFNTEGSLGLGDIAHRSSPVQVGSLTNWKQVSAGGLYQMMAIKTDGTLWAWGRGTNGLLGLNDLVHRSSPVQVGSLTNWKLVSSGTYFCSAIKTDGTLWMWGNAVNLVGSLGLGNYVHRSSPTQVGSLTNWKLVSSGLYHTNAIVSDDFYTYT